MDGNALRDRLNRGMGAAARRIGSLYTVYRPRGSAQPLASRNRIIRLHAAFNTGDDTFHAVAGYGGALWHGIFDAAYTQPGDYLVGPNSTFFIAAQRPLLPIQCVITNRAINMARPSVPAAGSYSGMVADNAQIEFAGWPAFVELLHARTDATPAETRFGTWQVLLPALPVTPAVNDVLSDNFGQTFAIAAAGLTDLGWRLLARQVAG